MTRRLSSLVRAALLCLPLLGVAGLAEALSLSSGKGRFWFDVPDTDRRLEVYSYLPDSAGPETPIVIVMTGARRNAVLNRDIWADKADEHGFIVLVPHFSSEEYRGASRYNLGNMVDSSTRRPNPREEWAFSVIEPLFEEVATTLDSERESYYLFGHSAGCQFVHRLLIFVPESRTEAAICSAAGWWTLPDDDVAWPYGLKNAPVDIPPEQLERYYELPMLIVVGEGDSDPHHSMLRRSSRAMDQGEHRLERARHYFQVVQQQAERNERPLRWEFFTIPDANHGSRRMATFAADRFARFENGEGFSTEGP